MKLSTYAEQKIWARVSTMFACNLSNCVNSQHNASFEARIWEQVKESFEEQVWLGVYVNVTAASQRVK